MFEGLANRSDRRWWGFASGCCRYYLVVVRGRGQPPQPQQQPVATASTTATTAATATPTDMRDPLLD